MGMPKGYMFMILLVIIVAPTRASGEVSGVAVSIEEVTLSHAGGGTVVNVTASIGGHTGHIEYCSLDVLVDGEIAHGECWSDIPGLAGANPGVDPPSTIRVCSVLTLGGEHTIGFRSYARDSRGSQATSEAGPFTWSMAAGAEDGPVIGAEVTVEGPEVTTRLSVYSSSGVQAVEETLIVNGLVGYRFETGSGALPPSPGLEVDRTLTLQVGGVDTVQLLLLATSGSGAQSLRMVSAPAAEAVEEAYRLRVITRGEGDTSPPEGNYTVSGGDRVLIQARPRRGATFLYWLIDGAVSGCDATLALPVTGCATVEAVFAGGEPGLLLLEGVEPGPTPWIVAPDGKVKLTILSQPEGEANIALWPGPGVYLTDAGCDVEVRCASTNADWVFREWSVSRGIGGVTRLQGEGPNNAARLRLTCDTVITALHSRRVR